MSMRNHKITCETCRWFNPHENTSTGICNFPKEEPASVEVCWLSKNNNACQQYAIADSSMYIELFDDKQGKPRFRIKGGNHEVVLSSQAYSSKSSRRNTIDSIMEQFKLTVDVIEDKHVEHRRDKG